MRSNRTTSPVTFSLAALSLGAMLLTTGCKKKPVPIINNPQQASAEMNLMDVPGQQANYSSAPAYAATTSTAPRTTAAPVTRVAGVSYQSQPAATTETYPEDSNEYADQYAQLDSDQDPYSEYVDNSVPPVETAPPPMPVYEQPEAPGEDYIYTPGYWDYANSGYYWVPGAWAQPPYVGALWTPGWWGYYGNRYRFHHGYWGRNVGFYGGINFGFGYRGIGYGGGYWNNNHFWYNRAYNRVPPRSAYIYNRPMQVNNYYINNTRASYYGGPGGVRRPPVRAELLARAQTVTPPMRMQLQNRQEAMQNRQQLYSVNRGRPAQFAVNHAITADRGIQRPAAVSNAVLQQRNQELNQRMQQRNQQMQQRNNVQQQRNVQAQQQTAQRQQQLQQRNTQMQQRQQAQQGQGRDARNQQMQQANQQRAQQQQRNQQLQQRQQQEQQRNTQMQQRNQQAAQQRSQQQQQQRVQEQQQQTQQRQQQQQQHQQEQVQRQEQAQQRQQQQQVRQQQMQQRQQQQVQRQQQHAQPAQHQQQQRQQQQGAPHEEHRR